VALGIYLCLDSVVFPVNPSPALPQVGTSMYNKKSVGPFNLYDKSGIICDWRHCGVSQQFLRVDNCHHAGRARVDESFRKSKLPPKDFPTPPTNFCIGRPQDLW
jgi:hypothetical protein